MGMHRLERANLGDLYLLFFWGGEKGSKEKGISPTVNLTRQVADNGHSRFSPPLSRTHNGFPNFALDRYRTFFFYVSFIFLISTSSGKSKFYSLEQTQKASLENSRFSAARDVWEINCCNNGPPCQGTDPCRSKKTLCPSP